MERFNLQKLNDVEVKEQYQVKISNMFATLENVGNNMHSNGALEVSGRMYELQTQTV